MTRLHTPAEVEKALGARRAQLHTRTPMEAAFYLAACGLLADIPPASVRLWIATYTGFEPELKALATDRALWKSIGRRVRNDLTLRTDDGLTARKTAAHLLRTIPDATSPRTRLALAALPGIWQRCQQGYGDRTYIAYADVAADLNTSIVTAGTRLQDLEALRVVNRRLVAGRVSRVRIATVPKAEWLVLRDDPRTDALVDVLPLLARVTTHPAIHYGNVLQPADPLLLLDIHIPGAARTLREARARLRALDITDLKGALQVLDARAGDTPAQYRAALDRRAAEREENAETLRTLSAAYKGTAGTRDERRAAVRDAKRAVDNAVKVLGRPDGLRGDDLRTYVSSLSRALETIDAGAAGPFLIDLYAPGREAVVAEKLVELTTSATAHIV